MEESGSKEASCRMEAFPVRLETEAVVSLKRRLLMPEFIDNPTLAPSLLEGELRGLERINRWSRSAAILWPSIQRLGGRLGPRPVRVLDIATGGGDVPIALWRRARRLGVNLEIDGCDINPNAVAYAARRAAAMGARARFFLLNAEEEALPAGYDLIMCSLFLHHLNDADAGRFLARMAAAARHTICVNDLLRSRRGLFLAYGGAFVLTGSAEVHADAPQSVRAAFTLDEVAQLAEQAGLHGFRLIRRWPCRFLFEWIRT